MTSTRYPPAIQNQVSKAQKYVGKPDRPEDEPVYRPPAKMTCTSTMGSASVMIDA